jgi:hypothetical protein
MRVPAYAIAEAPGRSVDHCLKVVASLQNQYGPGSTDMGRDLAEFVVPPARAVQIAQVHRDPIDPALVAVDGEFNASFDLLPQFLVRLDVPCSHSDLHRNLLWFLFRSLDSNHATI